MEVNEKERKTDALLLVVAVAVMFGVAILGSMLSYAQNEVPNEARLCRSACNVIDSDVFHAERDVCVCNHPVYGLGAYSGRFTHFEWLTADACGDWEIDPE